MSILHSPLQVGGVRLRNRIVMPPMATPKTEDDGLVTAELCGYYARRAGSVGLVITEHSYISQEGKAHSGQLSIAGDETVEGLSRLTAAVHKQGAAVFAQISHAGGRARSEVTGCPVVAPSDGPLPNSKPEAEVPRAMTEDEIGALIKNFSKAARRARQAGYDGVELHAAHSYLLNQFFSPLANRRGGRYSGETLQGRAQLLLDCVAAVREAAGPGFPIAVRLAAGDFIPGGITLQDAAETCRLLEQAGVQLLDISGGFQGYLRPGQTGEGYFGDLTQAIRAAVSVPVVLTGGVKTGAGAEQLLQEKKADLIGVGRALLKDPDWAQKALQETD